MGWSPAAMWTARDPPDTPVNVMTTSRSLWTFNVPERMPARATSTVTALTAVRLRSIDGCGAGVVAVVHDSDRNTPGVPSASMAGPASSLVVTDGSGRAWLTASTVAVDPAGASDATPDIHHARFEPMPHLGTVRSGYQVSVTWPGSVFTVPSRYLAAVVRLSWLSQTRWSSDG